MSAEKRFVKADWLNLALNLLGEEGPEAMTVERLCIAAKRTRGSLYHHFKDHQTLLHEVLNHWEEQYTVRLIITVGEPDENSSKALENLNTMAQALDFDIEVNIRRLVARHPSLQELVTRVDRTRIGFIQKHYEQIENKLPLEAKWIAELEYAIFIGTQHIDPNVSIARRNDLYKAFSRLLVLREKS